MNYFINDLVKLNSAEKVNAQSKARRDVMRTFVECGYEVCNILNYRYSWGKNKKYHHYPILTKWIADRQVRKFLKKVGKGDNIIIQDFHLGQMQLLTSGCKRKGAKVVFVIHDVQCIRFNIVNQEIEQLNNASLLLVHTNAMREKLQELGVRTPMLIMQIFDYYTDSPMKDTGDMMKIKHEVVFAGNLNKSKFLYGLSQSGVLKDVSIRMYGMLDKKYIHMLNEVPNMEYCGVFKPDDTGKITGGWGLIWDGDNISTCEGDYGDYLRYNSSHKASLYLACGLPIIVWKDSALAPWVMQEQVGIAIDSLEEMNDVIANISEEQYKMLTENAHRTGEQLRKGLLLKHLIENNL